MWTDEWTLKVSHPVVKFSRPHESEVSSRLATAHSLEEAQLEIVFSVGAVLLLKMTVW